MSEKVTFYAKKEAWEKFKERAYRSSGTLRGLSKQLNKIIEDQTLIDLEDKLSALVNSESQKSFSLEEIKQNRPKISVPAEEIIREMRDSN